MAEDPVEALFTQFLEFRPGVVGVRLEEDRADVDVAYSNGTSAQLRFRKEAAGWKFDLSHHLGPSVRILGDTCLIKRTYQAGQEERKP